jgi:hypothetical protein
MDENNLEPTPATNPVNEAGLVQNSAGGMKNSSSSMLTKSLIAGIAVLLIVVIGLVAYALSKDSSDNDDTNLDSNPITDQDSSGDLPVEEDEIDDSDDDKDDEIGDDGEDNATGDPPAVSGSDIKLTQRCGDKDASPITFSVPSDWTCRFANYEANGYFVEGKITSGSEITISSANLGRGGPCDYPGEDGPSTECTETVFYDNEFIKMTQYTGYQKPAGTGEIFGQYKANPENLGYISINIASGKKLSEKEILTIKKILEKFPICKDFVKVSRLYS